MPSSLQTLISNIPTAEDGHVIDRSYHNSLRDALIGIAEQLGATDQGDNLVLTYAPNFIANAPQPEWVFTLGYATKPAGGAGDGWIPLSLPDGSRLQRMVVVGGREETGTFSFTVQLMRQPLNDTTTTTLISVPGLATSQYAADPFEAVGVFAVQGVSSPAAVAEFQTVDNSQYKYLVRARLVGATATNIAVRIYGIRVELGGDLSNPSQGTRGALKLSAPLTS